MKLRVFAVADPAKLGNRRPQEPPTFQRLVKPADARRMVSRQSARYAVIHWDQDDRNPPRLLRCITPDQANDPRYQLAPDEEIILVAQQMSQDHEPQERHALRRDAVAVSLLRLDWCERPDPHDDMTHYCRTGHARSLAVLAPRPPAPDPIAAVAQQAAGGSRFAPTAGWRRGHGGGHQSIDAAQAHAAAQRA